MKVVALSLIVGFALATNADLIRVGTPGDYRPFSYIEEASGQRRGIDVDLVNAFAAASGHEIVWVETSWPTLTRDTRRASFDFAIGGISRNEARLDVGSMTRGYFITGKTLLRRCSFESKLDIASLNRPEHRVLVNPGGTNEQFVRAHLERTTITMHRDNLSMFRTLAAGPYDFMITDTIEAEVEAARYPALCATENHRFDRIEKAFFGPRDNPYLNAIDEWLKVSRETIQEIVEAYRP